MGYLVKYKKSDFIVNEVACYNLSIEKESAKFAVYCLEKKGYTTFEAIDVISKEFNISSDSINYSGLKDEDGITSQYISVDLQHEFDIHKLGAFNDRFIDNDNKIKLKFCGYSNNQISIGRIEGNDFRIIIRNIDKDFYDKNNRLKKFNLYFPNYYDTQRFGILNMPKVTHKIGYHLLNNELDKALDMLKISGTPETELLEKVDGSEVFEILDRRKYLFYFNSYYSYIFNDQIKKLISSYQKDYTENVYEGIELYLVKNVNVLKDMFISHEFTEINRAYMDIDMVKNRISKRKSVINTDVIFNRWFEDEENMGKYALEVSFFLPSGCYATIAIKQLMAFLEYTGN